MAIAQFVRDNKITITSDRTDSNPNLDDASNLDHWKCVLRMGSKQMTTMFSMGYGHNGKAPTAAEVLSCLAFDSSSVDDYSFDDWCSNFEYDTDSRKAEKTFKLCQHQAKRLQNFLGVDLYGQLLYAEGL